MMKAMSVSVALPFRFGSYRKSVRGSDDSADGEACPDEGKTIISFSP